MRRHAGFKCAAAVMLAGAVLLTHPMTLPVQGQLSPAGATAAVLSFIDAAAGRVEIVRHWPQTPVDVDVYPFVPYFWDGCPGPGAIMMLVTAPAASGPGVPSGNVNTQRIDGLAAGIAAGVSRTPGQLSGADVLRRVASDLRMPGERITEAVKALLPLIADLGTYERRGYAVFAFIAWQGWRCAVTLRAVPEGYGIPFVR